MKKWIAAVVAIGFAAHASDKGDRFLGAPNDFDKTLPSTMIVVALWQGCMEPRKGEAHESGFETGSRGAMFYCQCSTDAFLAEAKINQADTRLLCRAKAAAIVAQDAAAKKK